MNRNDFLIWSWEKRILPFLIFLLLVWFIQFVWHVFTSHGTERLLIVLLSTVFMLTMIAKLLKPMVYQLQLFTHQHQFIFWTIQLTGIFTGIYLMIHPAIEIWEFIFFMSIYILTITFDRLEKEK